MLTDLWVVQQEGRRETFGKGVTVSAEPTANGPRQVSVVVQVACRRTRTSWLSTELFQMSFGGLVKIFSHPAWWTSGRWDWGNGWAAPPGGPTRSSAGSCRCSSWSAASPRAGCRPRWGQWRWTPPGWCPRLGDAVKERRELIDVQNKTPPSLPITTRGGNHKVQFNLNFYQSITMYHIFYDCGWM